MNVVFMVRHALTNNTHTRARAQHLHYESVSIAIHVNISNIRNSVSVVAVVVAVVTGTLVKRVACCEQERQRSRRLHVKFFCGWGAPCY